MCHTEDDDAPRPQGARLRRTGEYAAGSATQRAQMQRHPNVTFISEQRLRRNRAGNPHLSLGWDLLLLPLQSELVALAGSLGIEDQILEVAPCS